MMPTGLVNRATRYFEAAAGLVNEGVLPEDFSAAHADQLAATFTRDAASLRGVPTIIDDANFYDQPNLLARFVRLAGFAGLLVGLDEMVNLYKLANSQARNSDYEQILRILNDALQGSTVGMRCPAVPGQRPN